MLRRRGVYFSLLTLAFSALTYAVAFRWTAFTGGENGLGGVTRAVWLGVDLANPWVYYSIVAAFGVFAVYALSRFHASPLGTVLLAIRENEQRAQFVGYATLSLQADRLCDLGDAHRRSPACCSRFITASPRPTPPRSRSRASSWRWSSSAACAACSARRWARSSTSCFANTCRSGRPTGCSSSGCCSSLSSSSRRPASSASGGALTAPMRARVVEAAAMAGRTIEQGAADARIPVPAAKRRRHALRSGGPGQELRRHPRGRRKRASPSPTARCTR